MKNWMLAILSVAFLAACQPKGYQITGTLEGATTGKVFLNNLKKGQPTPIDTAEIVDGTFTFTGSVEGPELFIAFVEGQQAPAAFFVENTNISITGDVTKLNEAEVVGSESNDIFAKLNKEVPGNERMKQMQQEFMQAQMSQDQEKMQVLSEEANSIMEDQKAYYEKFLEANATNAVGALMTVSMAQSKPLDEVKELAATLEASLPGHKYVAEVYEIIETREKMEAGATATKEGNVAPDFTLLSTDGKEIALSSFRGKYVLVDFWASWCGPCRQENPNVVKAYNKYNSKGFEVLSVSVDDDEAKWLEAIKADGLSWTQVRDTDKSVGTQYNVKQIPTTLLLDKEGVIIAKNLRGEALEAKLAELLN